MMIWGICGLVILAVLAVAGVRYWRVVTDPYAGLTLTRETSLDDATRNLLTSRMTTTRASIAAKEAAGETVETSLYESLAIDSYLVGDLVTARENYEIVLNASPMYAVAWNSYGNVLDAMGDYDAAARAYELAIEFASTIDEYYVDYARFLDKRYDGKDEEQRIVLEQGVKVAGQTTSLMNALAEWYTAHGDCTRAIAHYEVVRTLNPAVSASVDTKIAKARVECKAAGSEE